ncbi:DUF2127 domain-containing protein [Silvibacterium dinghuense]|uniref:DUF2127 domain-containing protein n=2 Tax=Silvibacterium dinghuense TaxID=1560006 RepID=A0A4Q1SCA2_9BACT|nr:DUF2127 domain-containing protein [Silvibacterium dinghuense]
MEGWVMAIGGLKMLEALLCILLGIGALRLLHKDLVDEATRVITALRLDPEGRFVNLLLDKIALISPHRLKQISLGIFAYAGLHTIEGVGLLLRKTWAEYVTLILTASFLPWEAFELFHHFTWIKVTLSFVNLLVVLFLLFYVRSRARVRGAEQENSRVAEATFSGKR